MPLCYDYDGAFIVVINNELVFNQDHITIS